MKKMIILSIAVLLTFSACSSDTESSNEDYAGIWYGYWLTGDYVRVDVRDTSYIAYVRDGTDFVPSDKGTIDKVDTDTLRVETTHYYNEYTEEWVEYYELNIGTYNVSDDGLILTLQIGFQTISLYSSEN